MAQVITQYLGGLERYEIVGTARDGERGLALIRSHPTDVAVIDLVLPNKDGFYVLEELSKHPDTKPVCIVLSGVSLEPITARAFEKGADYFILKPFDLELLSKRIAEVWEQKKNAVKINGLTVGPPAQPSQDKRKPEDFVLAVLHDIPISNTLDGYTFIKTAVLMAIENPEILEGITKRLYPTVAKRAGTTGSQVERAIRHAIDSAWRKGGGSNYIKIVGYGDANVKPTNSAFISALVELYHHRYGGLAGPT